MREKVKATESDRFRVELFAEEFKELSVQNRTFRASGLHFKCNDRMTADLKFAYQL